MKNLKKTLNSPFLTLNRNNSPEKTLNRNNSPERTFFSILTYVPSKNLVPLNIIFGLTEIYDYDIFSQKTLNKLTIGNIYTVYVKVKYSESSYFMAGNQTGFYYDPAKVDLSLKNLFQNLLCKLEVSFSEYSLCNEDILYIQVSFRLIDKKIYSDFKINTDLLYEETKEVPLHEFKKLYLNLSDYKDLTYPMIENIINTTLTYLGDLEETLDLISIELKEFTNSLNNKEKNNILKETQKIIKSPVEMSEDLLGKGLKVETDNFRITKVDVAIEGEKVNLLDVIKSQNKYLIKKSDVKESFTKDFKFYYVKSNVDYVLAVKPLNDNTVEKHRYSLTGTLITKVKDIYKENEITRICNNKEVRIIDNKIMSIKQNIRFLPLKKHILKDISVIPNPMIGTIDTETYLTEQNVNKIYALGFRTYLDDKAQTYYIETDTDSDNSSASNSSDQLVLKMINELLRNKYKGITFYCHNFSGYDCVFILHCLYNYNDSQTTEKNKYSISLILRDDKIIKTTIKKEGQTLNILDSYAMFPNSLAKLGKDFGVETIKSVFPYKFATENHLFYKGMTPSLSFYKEISPKEYELLCAEDWDFKEETIKYLEKDLNSLYEVLVSANRQVFIDYNINIMESITISGLAMKIFLSQYYNLNIPEIKKPSIYNDIKQAYYGGITEVYKPYGKNLFYLDVNSLYPYVALQNMPGLICQKITLFEKEVYKLEDLFGFFYCNVEAPQDLYIGLLPVRSKTGIEMPVGSWSGWYFSEELKFAVENGYKVSIIKGYKFNSTPHVFKDYIEKIYKIKSNPKNDSQKTMAKSLLNNLLGRFGISMDKSITELLDENSFNEKLLMNKITSHKRISQNKHLVSYVPKLDSNIIKSHKLDYLKLVNKYKDQEYPNIDNTSIAISAAITAYARIHINKIKSYILSTGANIYYTDTDSIVTDKELPKKLVNSDLGSLKLEHKIKEGIFITGKTYCLIDENGNFINKAKGIKSSSLDYSDYISLLNNINVNHAKKPLSKIDWEKGEVKIMTKENVNINANSYTKRTKIFDINLKWINTKPNHLINGVRSYHTDNRLKYRNYFDKDLIIYDPKRIKLNIIIYKNNALILFNNKPF